MRRRQQKNTLLPKMIGLAVVVNAVLLPILAQLGVFKDIHGQKLTPVELVKLPPPEKRPPPPKKAAKKQAAKPRPTGHKTAARAAAARRVPSGPPPVKVVAAGPAAGGPGGSGDAGIAPSGSGTSSLPAVPAPPPPTPAPPSTPPVPVPPPASPPPAPKSPVPPAPTPVAVLIAPQVVSQPKPVLPDDLSYDDIHGSFRALFTIHADGSTDVKMIASTGNNQLDQIALDAARQWRFHPATLNGKPVLGYTRLEVEFYASS